MDSLTFIIPAFNDEASITTVVEKSVRVGKKLRVPFRVMVINDASQDATGHMLKNLEKKIKELTVITHPTNEGYGQTIKELYQKARTTWLFSLPGDFQIDPDELRLLWPHRTKADMILGWRKKRRDSPARLGQSRMYNTLLRFAFGLTTHDVNSVRLMKTAVIKTLRLSSSSAFVDAELVIRSKRRGFRIIEIPISHRAREGAGASGGKLSTILPTIQDMITFLFRV